MVNRHKTELNPLTRRHMGQALASVPTQNKNLNSSSHKLKRCRTTPPAPGRELPISIRVSNISSNQLPPGA